MANNTSNVSAAKPRSAGAIYRSEVGVTLPTNATSELAAAFKNVGYISEDGVTNSRPITTESKKAWGGDTVIVLQSDRGDDYQFVMIEALNDEAMKTYNGDENVTGNLEDGITIKHNNADLGTHSYVIDEILRDGRLKRIVIPRGMISNTDDITYKDNDIIAYGVTVTALPDENGNSAMEYISGETE